MEDMKPSGLMLPPQLKIMDILETVPYVRNALCITQDLALLSVIFTTREREGIRQISASKRPPTTMHTEEPTCYIKGLGCRMLNKDVRERSQGIASVFIDPCGCGVRESDGFGGMDISLKDKNKAKTDKTKHRIKKSKRRRSRSYPRNPKAPHWLVKRGRGSRSQIEGLRVHYDLRAVDVDG
ncbi:hypothetical protein Tco_0893166 [Tanacetum coccineum]|uniref:Uncharacterized protein n=1 Tax=Tanacetum coccineum TaxID=301880 RepID=A0ABQ5CE75_9ASTR